MISSISDEVMPEEPELLPEGLELLPEEFDEVWSLEPDDFPQEVTVISIAKTKIATIEVLRIALIENFFFITYLSFIF